MSSGEAGIKLGHSTALQLLMMALHLTNNGQGFKVSHSHKPVRTLPEHNHRFTGWRCQGPPASTKAAWRRSSAAPICCWKAAQAAGATAAGEHAGAAAAEEHAGLAAGAAAGSATAGAATGVPAAAGAATTALAVIGSRDAGDHTRAGTNSMNSVNFSVGMEFGMVHVQPLSHATLSSVCCIGLCAPLCPAASAHLASPPHLHTFPTPPNRRTCRPCGAHVATPPPSSVLAPRPPLSRSASRLPSDGRYRRG